MSLKDPFGWQISTFIAWSMEKGKKGVYGSQFFRGKAGAAPQSISCNREPAECERYGGVVWVFRLIGITVNFLLGAGVWTRS